MTSPSEILSQEEVDALLQGQNGEEAPAAGADDELDEGPVRRYDLANPERTVRGRMPTLDIINDRLARLFRGALTEFLRRPLDVTAGGTKVHKFGEFLRNLVVPTNLNVMNLVSLRGMGLVVFEPTLVFAVVDNLFGGDGRYHVRVEGRDFTPTEQRIIERLLGVFVGQYQAAWEPVHPLGLEYVRSEMNTSFANIVSPQELVVTSTFSVEIGTATGDVHVCLPYSALEPIRDVLMSLRPAGEAEPDQRWLRSLSKQVQQAEVEIVAPLTHLVTPMAHLMKLKVGDVIAMDLPEHVMAEVEGVPLLECRYGTSNGHYALCIQRVVPVNTHEDNAGEHHE